MSTSLKKGTNIADIDMFCQLPPTIVSPLSNAYVFSGPNVHMKHFPWRFACLYMNTSIPARWNCSAASPDRSTKIWCFVRAQWLFDVCRERKPLFIDLNRPTGYPTRNSSNLVLVGCKIRLFDGDDIISMDLWVGGRIGNECPLLLLLLTRLHTHTHTRAHYTGRS